MRQLAAVLGGLALCAGQMAIAECRFGAPDPNWAARGYEITARTQGVTVEDLKQVAGRIDAHPVDLDSDGVPELCLNASTTMTCSLGVSVCLHMIWSLKDDRLLAQTATHSLGWGGLNPKGQYADLRSEWSSSDGCVYEGNFVWTAQGYEPSDATVIGQWADADSGATCATRQ